MTQTGTASLTDRVARHLDEVAAAPTVARARERAEALARTLVEFYGDALERVLEIVHNAAGERSEAIFAALCDDRLVDGLLAVHGLHPLSLEDRIDAALETVRPYLASHHGSVEFVQFEDGVAHVRLAGSCDGCRSAAATLRDAVEAALIERVPEVTAVRSVVPVGG